MNRNSCKGDIDTFLILARRGESEYKLRGVIDRAPVKEVTSWVDKEGLDLLHNVIIANNVEAVEYLLRHGFFVRPHVPETNPYSHLAALLGQRAMLQVLLLHRPDDFYPSKIPIKLSEKVVETIVSSGTTESHPDTEIKLKGLDDDNDDTDGPSTTPSSSSSTRITSGESTTRLSSSFSTAKRPGSSSFSSTKRPGSGTRSSPLNQKASTTSSSSTALSASTRPGSSSSSKRPGSASSTKRPGSGTSSSLANQKSSSSSSSSSTKVSASTKRPGSGVSSTKQKSSTSSTATPSHPTTTTTTTTTSAHQHHHHPDIPKFYIESLPTFLSNVEKTTPPSSTSQDQNPQLSPLDVASRTGKLECVKVILNQCVLKRHAEDYVDSKTKISSNASSDVALACVADNPLALALILHKTTRRSQSDWEAAVETCLHHARAECLNILLCVSPMDTRHMFKSTNFFHILFTSASMHGVKCYPRMGLTTQVLINHGHNVNAKMPCRTFPMYSLLTNAFCFTDYHNTSYYLQALRVLLKHGANPNFDEVDFEKKHPRQAVNKVVGREPYSSALHCLLETAERYADNMESPDLAVRFIEDCASVIMGSPHASMNVVGCVGDTKRGFQGNILHQLAKSSVALGANAEMFRCVLRHGADPNVKVMEKYAINVYFDTLFSTMKAIKSNGNHSRTTSVVSSSSSSSLSKSKSTTNNSNGHHPDVYSMDNARTVLRLCGFMVPSAIRDCVRLFLKDHGKESSPMIQPYVELVKTELESRSREVQTLIRASSWSVWKACGYRGDHVHTLKVSSELKTFILPMAF